MSTQGNNEKCSTPHGHITAYLHKGSPRFISMDPSNPQHGYMDFSEVDIKDTMEVENLIVSKASVFMAKRMVPGTSWGAGITHLEVGTGVGTGTTQAPQAEALTQTALRVGLARKAITSWTHLDTNGAATGTETNVVQYTTTFLEAEAVGALVEMGLFGGTATTTIGSGYMFNYKVFPVWNKGNDLQLTIVWKVTY